MDELNRVLAELMKEVPAGDNGTPAPGAAGAPAALPALPNLAGMLGGPPPDNRHLQLLRSLRPFLRPERQGQVDRLCRLLQRAYGVRGALQSLGGVLHV